MVIAEKAQDIKQQHKQQGGRIAQTKQVGRRHAVADGGDGPGEGGSDGVSDLQAEEEQAQDEVEGSLEEGGGGAATSSSSSSRRIQESIADEGDGGQGSERGGFEAGVGSEEPGEKGVVLVGTVLAGDVVPFAGDGEEESGEGEEVDEDGEAGVLFAGETGLYAGPSVHISELQG